MDNTLLRCLVRMIRAAIGGVVYMGAMDRLFGALTSEYVQTYGWSAYWHLFDTIEADIAA